MLGYDDNICFHTESAPPTFDTETLGLTLSPLLVREPAVAVWPRSRGCIWAAQGGGLQGLQRAAPGANALWNVEVYGSRNAIHREQLAGHQPRPESGGWSRPWPIAGMDADH